VEPTAADRDRAYAAALRAYAEHMRSLGCDYADYALYLQDEPGLTGPDAGFEAFCRSVAAVTGADPRIRIYANPAGGATPEMLAPLRDHVDVWAPDLHLVKANPEPLSAIFRSGKDYWHYEAPGDQRNLDPLGFYRMQAWVAFRMGMTGGGFWVYSSEPYWFTDRDRGSEYGTVYPAAAGPVTTMRWEATREGAQDFELLNMLREAAERRGGAQGSAMRRLLDDAVAFVTAGQERVSDISRQIDPYTPDCGRWMAYRRQIIEWLLQERR
jgi:hypothetical protein